MASVFRLSAPVPQLQLILDKKALLGKIGCSNKLGDWVFGENVANLLSLNVFDVHNGLLRVSCKQLFS